MKNTTLLFIVGALVVVGAVVYVVNKQGLMPAYQSSQVPEIQPSGAMGKVTTLSTTPTPQSTNGTSASASVVDTKLSALDKDGVSLNATDQPVDVMGE